MNDNCVDAIAIQDGATAFSTIGANTDGPAHGSCQFDGQTYSDIWYEYQASCTGELTVSTCGTASYDTDLVVYNGCDCGDLQLLGCNDDGSGCAGFTSIVNVDVVEDSCYLVRVGGFQSGDEGNGTVNLTCVPEGENVGACCADDECQGVMTQDECAAIEGGDFHDGILSCSPDPCNFGVGPDVIYSNFTSVASYGSIGGIRGYILDSFTCNVGTQDLLWGDSHDGTPVLAMNAYRLLDGRLEQIGMSWVKHACCAAAGSGCGFPCNGNGGSVLGSGCRDVYGTGWNGIQGRLGLRSNINAYSGELSSATGGSGDAIFKRLQIRESDLNLSNALYFMEGVYVASDDAPAGNSLNNATYRRANMNASFDISPTGTTFLGAPAIFAWRDHGHGADTPDKSVDIIEVDIPGEGRFYLANKVTDIGGGTWRYAYAIYNLNSHRSAGSFSVPIPPGVTVSTVRFHDVDYHSGEIYDNQDWSVSLEPGSVTWASPESFAENPNTNALRWGTMYTFWFEASAAPQAAEVTLGLFRPGIPQAVSVAASAPQAIGCSETCPTDVDGNGNTGAFDLASLLACWGPVVPGPCECLDIDEDGDLGPVDLAQLLALWGPCP